MMFNTVRHFLRLEAASGILLCTAALAALILCNSPFAPFLQKILQAPFWINEGLMTTFFLLIGLELKREIVAGELSSFKKIALPAVAALGGMAVPALIYAVLNGHNDVTLKGWAIPVATDIAFALGVLSLVSHRLPSGLRLFLMALAIFDDVGAIIIIAIFHTHALSWLWAFFAIVVLLMLVALNRTGVRHLLPYLMLGVVLWVCVLGSGVHATIAGVLLALTLPFRCRANETESPLQKLENGLHPWVAYGVMPLFAFANAGVSLSGLSWGMLLDPIPMGIIAGLFLGKQIGVFGFSWLMVKFKFASLPARTTWRQLYGVALLCGIGFTMSLFIGTLAFQNEPPLFLVKVRLGVLVASLLAGTIGALVLRRNEQR